MPERKIELTPEEKRLDELNQQITDKIREETPPGPLETQIVYKSKWYAVRGYRVIHQVSVNNSGWNDTIKRVPERVSKKVKLPPTFVAAAKTNRI
jgi:hypothetical protein